MVGDCRLGVEPLSVVVGADAVLTGPSANGVYGNARVPRYSSTDAANASALSL